VCTFLESAASGSEPGRGASQELLVSCKAASRSGLFSHHMLRDVQRNRKRKRKRERVIVRSRKTEGWRRRKKDCIRQTVREVEEEL